MDFSVLGITNYIIVDSPISNGENPLHNDCCKVDFLFGTSRLFYRRKYRLSVYFEIVETNIFYTARNKDSFLRVFRGFLYIVELAVIDLYVIYVVAAFESHEVNAEVAATGADDILAKHVTYCRREIAVAKFFVFVLEVDTQHGFAALSDLDVAYINILDDAAATVAGLDANHAVEVGAVHFAVLHEKIFVTAGDFATDYYAAVSVEHLAVAHDDVLTGHIPCTTVAVATALDGDAVVAGIEYAVFNQYAVARLGVAAVAVRTVIVKGNATHDQVVAEQRVQRPERRIFQRYIFYQHAVAAI